jgi:glycosyltransferase involved in cell wall biosynthesis
MRSAPKILAIVPTLIASCHINVLKPMKKLAARGLIDFRWRLEAKADAADIHWADLIVFCRNTEPAYANLLNEAVCTSKPIVYDLDDNFWDIPYETDPELARYHRLPPRLSQLEQYLTLSTLVRVYSPVLANRVSEFSKNIRQLKSGFDFSLVGRKDARTHDKVRIVYATSRIVDDQYHEFLGGILRVLDEFGDQITLTLWGCQPSELAGRQSVELLPLFPDYEGFLREFSAKGFDIGLAPLPDTVFHRSKNNTKFRDYGACRVAGVYSNVDLYSSCIEDNSTGVLVANTPDGWYEGIVRLIKDRKLIETIKKNAYDEVFSHYRQELVEDEWMQQINELLFQNIPYLTQSSSRFVTEMRVRTDFSGLYGIRIPSHSPDGDKVGRILLEVLTPNGDLLRDASSVTVERLDDGDIEISFVPIVNTTKREFVFRFVAFSENPDAAPGWVPPSGMIEMLYKSRTASTARAVC